MQNYHRHSSYSNLSTPDCTVSNEDYAKRAVELGHKIICSVEHGWQGYYFETYELAKKYNLKCVIGSEAYWVKDRFAQDKSNHHIIILAKNNNGREALNDILSEANISGYYYKPRIDLELLLSLPPNDVFITTACIAFSGDEDVDDTILKLHNHFGKNFMLEVQYHNTEKQKEWHKHLLYLSEKFDIELIVGLDSHYISKEQSIDRDLFLEAKGLNYEDEYGWYMDYPDDNTVFERFKEQGILSEAQIRKAMDNTDILLTFEDYDDVPIFNKDIKLPTLYPDKTKEEKDKIYSKLISKKFVDYMKNVPESEYQKYFDGVKMEVQTYKDTGMVDYPLLDYAIIKDAKEHGGLITDTGRGSAVSYFTNTLCGFSSVNRFTSAIKLYPERFISTTRILETHSLPDIDVNTGTVSILEDSQRRVLGDDHVAPMVAFGTLKKKSAWKIYAKAQNVPFDVANEISNQISEYEEALKNAEDDEEINIDDYISESYHEYLKESEKYWGIISDKKKAPSAYLLYQGNIRREIGLMKCKSDSTKKEYITCVIDGAIAENYKFLKNDLLKVDVVLLIDKVFKRAGVEHFNVDTLLQKTKDNSKVWDIYKNGYTVGINQVEQDGSRHKVMNYKPTNIAELSAFVAAVRPGFKSMYKKFEAREDFSWGIKTLDNLLRTDELPVSFVFFQEQCMMILSYAGFPMDQCYGIIKAIAKKHPEKVRPLKAKFLEGFKQKVIDEENVNDETAIDYANQVWEIINNTCNYSFNASHALCVAGDSLYQAYQKAEYPYEFYEVNLQHFSDKGKKDKVSLFKTEMLKAFGIKEGPYKFRLDNRKFTADKENHCINPALSSIKSLNDQIAEDLYSIKDIKVNSFIDILILLKGLKINASQLDILIKLDYFGEFGNPNQLLAQVKMFNDIYGKKQFKKDKLEELGIPEYLIKQCAAKETDKMYTSVDTKKLLGAMVKKTEEIKTSVIEKLQYQAEYLGYLNLTIPNANPDYFYVQEYEKGWVTLYRLTNGETLKIKCRNNDWKKNQFNPTQIIKVIKIKDDKRWSKDADGKWIRLDETEPILSQWVVLKNN